MRRSLVCTYCSIETKNGDHLSKQMIIAAPQSSVLWQPLHISLPLAREAEGEITMKRRGEVYDWPGIHS